MVNRNMKINPESDFYKWIYECGGWQAVAHEVGLDPLSVRRWNRKGIPLEYWPTLRKKYGTTVERLYSMSIKNIAAYYKATQK